MGDNVEKGRDEIQDDFEEEEHDQGLQNAPDLNTVGGNIMVEPTHINIIYETLPCSNVLFNTYKINANSELVTFFNAFKERYMNSLKDLILNAHLPVIKREDEKKSTASCSILGEHWS